jgi:hypothetical protein
MLPDGYTIDQMRAGEVPVLVSWAAAEGWNPGDGDVALAWSLDADAFIALRRGDELVGGGTVFSYDGAFGFMGMFIVRSDLRGQGLGTDLWFERRSRMVARLQPGASVGMDGVFAMVPFYAAGGFELAFRGLRMEGTAPAADAWPGSPPTAGAEVVPVASLPFEDVDAYDRSHVAAPRTAFLRGWFDRPGVVALAAVADGEVVGIGAVRPAALGHRIGPLFADTPAVAEQLLAGLCAAVPGAQVQLDVPEVNEAGLALAARLGWTESFGCARMYLGGDPGLPVDRIYGITSFEFG